MGYLLLQAVQESTVVEMAFSNEWRFGVPITPGDITINGLCAITPLTSTAELKRKEIVAKLEEDPERTFKCDL